MKIEIDKNFVDRSETGFPIRYIASFSIGMRLLKQSIPIQSSERLFQLIEDTILQFDEDSELKKSIKSSLLNYENFRQCDIKSGDYVMVKTFLGWNKEQDCWHVLVELPTENEFEKKMISSRNN